ncbi:MAG: 4-hydroxy-3-methylbut-2-enyl diphosphate reductase [Candidatus Omnitrophica bacterium]|nr:4-hydroxy-3-methylbut-2-enyl diphosphate reductase [Candidatus Omnitrophota bacterium]
MKCILAKHSGFCHGVKYTVSSIESLLRHGKEDVYCIGLPVHNRQVTEQLINNGLQVVNEVNEIEKGTLVIRAHGLPPQLIDRAKKQKLKIVNTTCGFVVNAQNIAQLLYKDGYTVIIVGEREHPEVKTIYGVTDEHGIICSSVEESVGISCSGKVGIVSQTTFSENQYQQIVTSFLHKDIPELRIFDTICDSIEKRSIAAQEVALQVDIMLIVGGKMSSNTKRLFEACKAVNVQSHHIETKDEVVETWFKQAHTVGITAGASTPQGVIDDIRAFVEKL